VGFIVPGGSPGESVPAFRCLSTRRFAARDLPEEDLMANSTEKWFSDESVKPA
jgi:hypothetical protein